MKENSDEVKRCKICGKIIVGENKTGICGECKKKIGDGGTAAAGVLTIIGGVVLTIAKKIILKR